MQARIVVLADVNNNLVDGSVIWLQNLMLALTRTESPDETLLLLRENRSAESFLFPPSLSFPCCRIVAPADISQLDVRSHDALLPDRLPQILALLETRFGPIDSILVRGHRYAVELMRSPRFRNRVCVYTTERPRFSSTAASAFDSLLVEHAKHIFVQSEAQKRYFEVFVQAPSRLVTALPPMVRLQDRRADSVESLAADKQQTLSYAGKLDREYRVEELVDLAPAIEQMGYAVEVVGNKFNKADGDADFVPRLRNKLERSAGLAWVQGATHEESQARMGKARFGYCVRSASLDNSVELSTKLLEYCAAGTPPILRRTPQHVTLFGADYPFFAESPQDIQRILQANRNVDDIYLATVERLLDTAAQFDISKIAQRLAPLRARHRHATFNRTADPHTQVLVATHDDKFISAALMRLSADTRLSVIYDPWKGTRDRGSDGPDDTAAQSDVIFCEWCCEQAVWWSQRKRRGQRLVVRLHRFEAFEDFPSRVDWSAVDHLIVVSQYFKDLVVSKFGVPSQIIHVLPQYVDTSDFDRPKLSSASHRVGLVGINSFSHKRPDRAIEFIDRLRQHDSRFSLRIRSRLPWEYKWVWKDRPTEREDFVRLLRSCLTSPRREYIDFDRAGADMPEWFRSVNVILSSSDTEGCHTSVAEGMAAGCFPVCYAWPGAQSVYGRRFVHESVDAMVEATLQANDYLHSPAGIAEMKNQVARFDISVTTDFLRKVFLQ